MCYDGDVNTEQRVYWCAETDPKKFIARVQQRMSWRLQQLRQSGRWQRGRALLSAYYGFGTDGMRISTSLVDAGDDGEVTELQVNNIRPTVNNTLSLVAGNELKLKAKARNGDAKALAQARLAEQLLQVEDGTAMSREAEIDVLRGAFLASEWMLAQAWMPQGGKEWAVDGAGQPVFEGALQEFVVPIWRYAFDASSGDTTHRNWVIFRRPRSRYDLAAELERLGRGVDADKLRKGDDGHSSMTEWWRTIIGSGVDTLEVLMGEQVETETTVWVWEVRHLPSPALPDGRMVRFVEPDIILFDSLESGAGYPYRFDDLHAYEYSPERVVSGTGGHTGAFDLGGMQEVLDILHTAVTTNANIAGQLMLWSSGEVPNVSTLGNGSRVLVSQVKPEPIEWPAFKAELLQAAEYFKSGMASSMALNDVVMGKPEKGMPASAQALQRAQAQQFHEVAQRERVRLRARSANGKLRLLQRFAKSPRVAQIAGKAGAYELKQWQSDDIADVELFEVEPVDPMSGTFEGRQATLELLLANGVIKTPDAMLTYLQTGSLAAVTTNETMQRELVEANVAMLQRGVGLPEVQLTPMGPPQFLEPTDGREVVRILKTDPHHLAIPAYLGVLASPASRADSAIMQACIDAVQYSYMLWQQLAPDECFAYGIPPLPMMMAMMGPPPGAPPGGPTDAPPEVGGEAPIDEPDMPAPPENPLTGAQEDAGATGLPQ